MKPVIFFQILLYLLIMAGVMYLSIDSLMKFSSGNSTLELTKGLVLLCFSLFMLGKCCMIALRCIRDSDGKC